MWRRVLCTVCLLLLQGVMLHAQGEELPSDLGCYRNHREMLDSVKKVHKRLTAHMKKGVLVWDSTLQPVSGKWIWNALLETKKCPGKYRLYQYTIFDQYLVKVP